MTIPPTLKDLRREAGVSQQELAARAGCSVAYVRMIEGGWRPAQSDVLPRILAVLTASKDAT